MSNLRRYATGPSSAGGRAGLHLLDSWMMTFHQNFILITAYTGASAIGTSRRLREFDEKVGSNLGQLAAENRVKPWSMTQSQGKRINEITFRFVVSGLGAQINIELISG